MKVKKLKKEAIVPSKDIGNGGYDLYTTDDEIYLKPGGIHFFSTGISIEIEEGMTFLLRERGSTGTKGISVRAGVVDSNYRGEIFVAINNTSTKDILFTKYPDQFATSDYAKAIIYDLNKAIAQGLLVHTPHVEIEVVEELSETERGDGKLGSTGK
jgi:dUTP pyrophosphatase